MTKEQLLNQKLYFVKSNLTETPYFVNSEYFVIFTNVNLAIDFAQKVSKRLQRSYSVANSPASACAITNNDLFFKEMISMGFSKFSFNGEGKILDLNTIYNRENRVTPQTKECYLSYMGLLKMQKSAHIGSEKTKKIESIKQQLKSSNNATIVQDFSRSQHILKDYYMEMASEDAPAPVTIETATKKPPTDYPPAEFTIADPPQTSHPKVTVTKTEVIQKNEKNNRPIIATIFLIIGAIYFFESFFFIAEDGFNEGFPLTVCGLFFLVFAIVMFKKYLKGFGWVILSGIFLTTTAECICSGEKLSTIITSIIITAMFGGLVIWANRKKQQVK